MEHRIAPLLLAVALAACAANPDDLYGTSSDAVQAGLLCAGADSAAAGMCNGPVSVDVMVTHTAYDIPPGQAPHTSLEDDYYANSCDCGFSLASLCRARSSMCELSTTDGDPVVGCSTEGVTVFYVAREVSHRLWRCDVPFDPSTRNPIDGRPEDHPDCTLWEGEAVAPGWAATGSCHTRCSGTCAGTDEPVIEDPHGDHQGPHENDPHGSDPHRPDAHGEPPEGGEHNPHGG